MSRDILWLCIRWYHSHVPALAIKRITIYMIYFESIRCYSHEKTVEINTSIPSGITTARTSRAPSPLIDHLEIIIVYHDLGDDLSFSIS